MSVPLITGTNIERDEYYNNNITYPNIQELQEPRFHDIPKYNSVYFLSSGYYFQPGTALKRQICQYWSAQTVRKRKSTIVIWIIM